jgi:hypothetical protein
VLAAFTGFDLVFFDVSRPAEMRDERLPVPFSMTFLTISAARVVGFGARPPAEVVRVERLGPVGGVLTVPAPLGPLDWRLERPAPLPPAGASMSRSPSRSAFTGPLEPRFLIPEGRPVVFVGAEELRWLRWLRGPEGAMAKVICADGDVGGDTGSSRGVKRSRGGLKGGSGITLPMKGDLGGGLAS